MQTRRERQNTGPIDKQTITGNQNNILHAMRCRASVRITFDEKMKEMMKSYLILVLGIPILLAASCFLFRDIPVAGALVYVIPVIMLAVFMWRLFSTNPKRKAIHIAAGFLCMIGTWFLSVLIIGAIAISQTGLEGTQ